jgi:nucleoside-diphosphate-sugar epimerase
MSKILITGGAGYIGSSLLSDNRPGCITVFDNLYWNQGAFVYPLLRSFPFFNESVLGWSDDLKREIERADVIIPLAALVGAPLCEKEPGLAQELNYLWFEKLLGYLDNQLVVYPNTNSGYGSTGENICTEETPTAPISLYGKTKQQTEDLLLNNYDNAIVFRLATVFGWSHRPRMDLLVNNLTLTAYQNKTLEIFDGHFRRNYIHVKDVAEGFAFAVQNRDRMKGNVYNLGNDSINMTKESLAHIICDVTGASYVPVSHRTDPDKRDYIVSSQKLYDLGYKPKIDLREGIKEILEFCAFDPTKGEPQLNNY